jgi:prepilin-type N-terminal cleavage/methylation domain-containing protein
MAPNSEPPMTGMTRIWREALLSAPPPHRFVESRPFAVSRFQLRKLSRTKRSLGRHSLSTRRSFTRRLVGEGGNASTLERLNAFTLLELLIVVGIIGLLMVLIAPAFTTMKSGSDFTNAVYGIQGVLENARTYAKANRTYVFVGFAEVDSSVDSGVSPQVTTGATPYGRVAVAVVASKDGTRHFNYAITGQGSDWTANYSNGANLVAIGKLQRYENLHFLVDFGSWTPTTFPNSKMARYQPTGPPYILGNAGSSSVTPFSWPLGSSLGNGQYNFTRVIYFDPTGTARIATSTNADTIAHVIEIDLQPTHGIVTPTPPQSQDVGNHAVVQLGTTDGAVRVYRP